MTMPAHMLGQQPQQRQRAVSASSSTTAGVGASLASSLSSTTSTGKVSKASGSGVTKRSMGAVTSVDDLEAKQAKPTTNRADINEKRRRRRESHNAVERRRRDNINEKIQELSSLLPDFGSDVQNKVLLFAATGLEVSELRNHLVFPLSLVPLGLDPSSLCRVHQNDASPRVASARADDGAGKRLPTPPSALRNGRARASFDGPSGNCIRASSTVWCHGRGRLWRHRRRGLSPRWTAGWR
ncbi:hypothetical protein DFJ73DRAFT_390424 [Zopfochytrium polystomum]|nr:hypothetical protein DFJ73DRAFT_390424 [Zopfochytrium polystomum]